MKQFLKVMKSLGLLSSLVFVREIHANAEKYISDVEQAAKTYVLELRQFDISIENKNPYCTLLKAHLLLHIADNIRKFGCALHLETERGKQMNKYIRQHIQHTNGHNCTRDIALCFGREIMLHHVLDGGFWKGRDGHLVSLGGKAKNWIEENGKPFYMKLLGGSKMSEDNNYVLQVIKPGVCAVFSYVQSRSEGKPYFIGDARKENDELYLDVYEVCEVNQERQVIKTRKTDNTIKRQDATAEIIIDMHMTDNDGQRLVNVCKFSTYWFLTENMSQLQ
jgi:hypothetical protein